VNGGRRTLVGRYELAEVLGRGGMGTVYRATDLVLGRTVAVKVLAAALAEEDPIHVARFEREARAAASLSDPAVVAVYDTGADEATRFIVMEYVAGRSLAAILRDKAPIEPHRAVNIAERMAEALAAAHGAGIVHRDVKPGNVMVADDGSVKVLDFGLARALDGTALTQTASVLGTAAFMAPEQALGERIDERSDIYSLGCVLYAMLAGRPPFTGETAAAITHQHVHVDPRPLHEANRRVPPPLDALVLQLLAKSPADRPQSAGRVRDRLGQTLGEPPATGVSRTPTARPQRTPATTRILPHAARVKHGRLATAAAVCGGVLLVVVIALASGGSSRHLAPPARFASTASKSTPAPAVSRTTATRSSGASASTPAAAPSNTAPATTVPRAAGALTSTVTQELESGKIDHNAAQQITKALGDILNSYGMGHATDAQHKLADLAKKMETLETRRDISSTAASPLSAALGSLSTAIASSAPATPQTHTGPSAAEGQPGDEGRQPPGQAKKRGDLHGERQGD
jgi:eukaryotic-like serine/threonine-protein kinase